MRRLEVRQLGVQSYPASLALQRHLVEQRRADRIPDQLLLLQHPPVITLGVRRSSQSHILADQSRLAELGVTVHETGRGGDVTFHGPGQVVAYPIIDLRPDRCDVHRYVRDLEDVMIRVCADYGVTAARVTGMTGAWVGEEKIGAIGVRISRWITSHGFALNVNPDLRFFQLIVPCGIADRGVTSLVGMTKRKIDLADVERSCAERFAAVFEREAVIPEVALAR